MTIKEKTPSTQVETQEASRLTKISMHVDKKLLAAAMRKGLEQEGKTVEILINEWLRSYVTSTPVPKPEPKRDRLKDSVMYRGF